MTTYITVEDLILQYTEQDFPRNIEGNPDLDFIENCCEQAANVIDSVLRNAEVEFPISADTILELQYTAMCLARHRYKQRGGITESIQVEKDAANAYLEKIRMNQNTLSSLPRKGGLYNIRFSWSG